MLKKFDHFTKLLKKKYSLYILLFFIFFAFFVFRDLYVIPSELEITGKYKSPVNVKLRWDSGRGFTDHEYIPIKLGRFTPFKKKKHKVRIWSSLSEKSKISPVLITKILVDNKLLKQKRILNKASGGKKRKGKHHSTIEFEAEFSRLDVTARTGNPDDILNISIDGITQRYSFGPGRRVRDIKVMKFVAGRHRVKIRLPRVDTKRIKLEADQRLYSLQSVKILRKDGSEHSLPISRSGMEKYLTYSGQVNTTTLYFPLLAIQAFLAFLLVLSIHLVMEIKERSGCDSMRSFFYWIFRNDRQPMFWYFFSFAVFIYSIWLLAWWPAYIDYDAFNCWGLSYSLGAGTARPFSMSVYFRLFSQFYDSPASTALFQVLFSAWISSYIPYRSFKAGVPVLAVLPFYLLSVFSIPVCVYNLFLCRSGPNALLICFFSWWIFSLKINRNQNSDHGATYLIITAIMLVSLFSFRPDSIPAVLYIFAIIPVFKLLNKKSFCILVSLFALFFILFSTVKQAGNIAPKTFNRGFMKVPINPVASLFSNKWGYYAKTPEKDKETVERFIPVTKMTTHYNPYRTGFIFTHMHKKLNQATNETRRDWLKLYVNGSLNNMHIFMADRVYTFFSMRGFGGNKFVTILSSGGGEIIRPETCVPVDHKHRKQFPETAQIIRPLLSEKAHKFFKRLAIETSTYRGVFNINFLIWNLLPRLMLVLVFFFLYKWFPATALACSFVLVSVAVRFIVNMSTMYRHLYFLYPFAIYIIPMALMEWKTRSHSSKTGSA